MSACVGYYTHTGISEFYPPRRPRGSDTPATVSTVRESTQILVFKTPFSNTRNQSSLEIWVIPGLEQRESFVISYLNARTLEDLLKNIRVNLKELGMNKQTK